MLVNRLSVILLISFFLTGCGYTWIATPKDINDHYVCKVTHAFPQLLKIPAFENAWQMIHNCHTQRREKTSIAMLAFYKEWAITFGDPRIRVYKVMSNLLVEWGNKNKTGNGYSINGIKVRQGRVMGLALPPTMIWIYTQEHQLICESSLAHELMHIAIWVNKRSDGDPDHEGKRWSGWTSKHTQLINRVNQHLCNLGI